MTGQCQTPHTVRATLVSTPPRPCSQTPLFSTLANPLFRCQPFSCRLDWSQWSWHIPACPLCKPPPPTSSNPHLLEDYHVIPDHCQSGRSRGRFITIQHSLSSCRGPAGLLLVGPAVGGGRIKAPTFQHRRRWTTQKAGKGFYYSKGKCDCYSNKMLCVFFQPEIEKT